MSSDFPLKANISNQSSVNSLKERILTQSENCKHQQSRFHPYSKEFLPYANKFTNDHKSLGSCGPPSDRLSGRWKGYYYNPLNKQINTPSYGNFQDLYKNNDGDYSNIANKSYYDLLRFSRISRMKKERLLHQNECNRDLITSESNLKETRMHRFQNSNLYGEFQKKILDNKDVKVIRNEIQKDNINEIRKHTFCLYQDQRKDNKLAIASTQLNKGNIGINYAKRDKLNQAQNEMLNVNLHYDQMVNNRLTENYHYQKERNSYNETFKFPNWIPEVKESAYCFKTLSEIENTQLNTSFQKKRKSVHSIESDICGLSLQAVSNIKKELNSDAYQNSQRFYKNLANGTDISVNNYIDKTANNMYSYQRITERKNDAISSERAPADAVNEILQNNSNSNQILNNVSQNNSILQSTEASNLIKKGGENSFIASENRTKSINEINKIVLDCNAATCRRDLSPFKLKVVEPFSKINENFKSKENTCQIPPKMRINCKVAESENDFIHIIRTSTETSCKFNDSVHYLNGKEDASNHFKRKSKESESKDNEDIQHKNCAQATANSLNGCRSIFFERSIETLDYNGKLLKDGKSKKVTIWNPAFPCRKENNVPIKMYQNDKKHLSKNIEFVPDIKRNKTNEKPFAYVSSDESKREYKTPLLGNNTYQYLEGLENDKVLTSKSSCYSYGNPRVFCRETQNRKEDKRQILEKNENVRRVEMSKIKQQLLVRKINNSNLLQAVKSHTINTAKLQRKRFPILRRKFLTKDFNNVIKNKTMNPLPIRTPTKYQDASAKEEYPLAHTDRKNLEKKANIHDSTKRTHLMFKDDVAGNSENIYESRNVKTHNSVPLLQDNENCSSYNLYKWIAVLQTFLLELKVAKRNFSLNFPVKKQISEEELSSEFENEVYLTVFKQMGLSCSPQSMNPPGAIPRDSA